MNWQPIESAPVGDPATDVGVRESSEWFLGLRKDGHILKIRRASNVVGHDWEDFDHTYYTNIDEPWFTHWTPLTDPLEKYQ